MYLDDEIEVANLQAEMSTDAWIISQFTRSVLLTTIAQLFLQLLTQASALLLRIVAAQMALGLHLVAGLDNFVSNAAGTRLECRKRDLSSGNTQLHTITYFFHSMARRETGVRGCHAFMARRTKGGRFQEKH